MIDQEKLKRDLAEEQRKFEIAQGIDPYTTEKISGEMRRLAFIAKYGKDGECIYAQYVAKNKGCNDVSDIANLISPGSVYNDPLRKMTDEDRNGVHKLLAQMTLDEEVARKKYPGLQGQQLSNAIQREAYLRECREKVNN